MALSRRDLMKWSVLTAAGLWVPEQAAAPGAIQVPPARFRMKPRRLQIGSWAI